MGGDSYYLGLIREPKKKKGERVLLGNLEKATELLPGLRKKRVTTRGPGFRALGSQGLRV